MVKPPPGSSHVSRAAYLKEEPDRRNTLVQPGARQYLGEADETDPVRCDVSGIAVQPLDRTMGEGCGRQEEPGRGAPEPERGQPEDFVGAETCETCHADVAKKFAENPIRAWL